jgi:hypothetical protein
MAERAQLAGKMPLKKCGGGFIVRSVVAGNPDS